MWCQNIVRPFLCVALIVIEYKDYSSFHKGGIHSYATSFSIVKQIEIDLKTTLNLDKNKKVFKFTFIFHWSCWTHQWFVFLYLVEGM
jgi:hypothetical protein